MEIKGDISKGIQKENPDIATNGLFHVDNMQYEKGYYKACTGNSVRYEIPENQIFIGGTDFDNKIILFYYDTIIDIVFIYLIENDNINIIWSGDLKVTKDDYIKIKVYKNEEKYIVYFVDNKNPVRYFELNNIPSDEKEMNIIRTEPELTYSSLTKIKGKLKPGVYTYFYRLISNDGYASKYRYFYKPIYIEGLNNYNNKDGSILSYNGIDISLVLDESLVERYKYIEIIRAHSVAEKDIPACYLIYRGTLNGYVVNYLDVNSSVLLSTITYDELLIPKEKIIAGEIEIIEDRLVLGNIEKPGYIIDYDYYDTRVYSFDENHNIGNYNNTEGDLNVNFNLPKWGIPNNANVKSPLNKELMSRELSPYQYTRGGNIGYEGPNVRIDIIQQYYNYLKSKDEIYDILGNGIPTLNYGEIYPIAIQFENYEGELSNPLWMCNLRIPYPTDNDPLTRQPFIREELINGYNTYSFLKFIPQIIFKTELPANVKSHRILINYDMVHNIKDSGYCSKALDNNESHESTLPGVLNNFGYKYKMGVFPNYLINRLGTKDENLQLKTVAIVEKMELFTNTYTPSFFNTNSYGIKNTINKSFMNTSDSVCNATIRTISSQSETTDLNYIKVINRPSGGRYSRVCFLNTDSNIAGDNNNYIEYCQLINFVGDTPVDTHNKRESIIYKPYTIFQTRDNNPAYTLYNSENSFFSMFEIPRYFAAIDNAVLYILPLISNINAAMINKKFLINNNKLLNPKSLVLNDSDLEEQNENTVSFHDYCAVYSNSSILESIATVKEIVNLNTKYPDMIIYSEPKGYVNYLNGMLNFKTNNFIKTGSEEIVNLFYGKSLLIFSKTNIYSSFYQEKALLQSDSGKIITGTGDLFSKPNLVANNTGTNRRTKLFLHNSILFYFDNTNKEVCIISGAEVKSINSILGLNIFLNKNTNDNSYMTATYNEKTKQIMLSLVYEENNNIIIGINHLMYERSGYHELTIPDFHEVFKLNQYYNIGNYNYKCVDMYKFVRLDYEYPVIPSIYPISINIQQYITNRKSFTLLLDENGFLLRSFLTNKAKNYFRVNNEVLGVDRNLYLYNDTNSNMLNDADIIFSISLTFAMANKIEASTIVASIDNIENITNAGNDIYYNYNGYLYDLFKYVFVKTNTGNRGSSKIIIRDNTPNKVLLSTGILPEQNEQYIYNTEIVYNQVYIPLPAVLFIEAPNYNVKKFNTGVYLVATLYTTKNDINKIVRYLDFSLLTKQIL